jgi:hypothetical protein
MRKNLFILILTSIYIIIQPVKSESNPYETELQALEQKEIENNEIDDKLVENINLSDSINEQSAAPVRPGPTLSLPSFKTQKKIRRVPSR